MKKKLKLQFGYFWDGFDPMDNMFSRSLSRKYDVEISTDPDYYFFTHSYDGNKDYLNYNCHRIFWGLENVRADWNICDYVLDFDFCENNPRHKRFPLWAAWQTEKLCLPKDMTAFENKKKFCCMLVSNPRAKERIEFFHKLSKYKKVDSAGKHLNNVGYSVENKLEFIKDYKFVISFENSSWPGYTTEKLVETMFANCIPVYWGNPVVGRDFNTKSFINIHDLASYEHAIDHIIKLDNDRASFLEMAAEPWYNNDIFPQEFSEESLADFFDFVIGDSKTKKPVAKSTYHQYSHKATLVKQNLLFLLQTAFNKAD